MLFRRHRIVGAAFDSGVVAHDHALLSLDTTYAGDDARRWRSIVVHIECSELGKFKEWRTGIEQLIHALARQQLAAIRVFFTRILTTAERQFFAMRAQIIHQSLHGSGVGDVISGPGIEFGFKNGHVH